MSSILKKPTVSPVKGRNGFDMSRRRLFTSPCGMLLPVFHDFSNPGDKYVLNSSLLVRTEAVQTAAFMRLKAHVEWFFVPITQLYSMWNEVFNGTDDIMSSVYYSPAANASSFSVPTVTPHLPLFELSRFIQFDRNGLFGANGPGDMYILSCDEFGVPNAWNFRRLFDLLGYGNLSDFISATEDFSYKLPMLPFLAYHKIFHSHYNLTDWFRNNPLLYNVDKWFNVDVVPDNVAEKILGTIHYRPYRKDYFTNILPTPLFNDNFASFIKNQFNNGLSPISQLLNPEVSGSSSALENFNLSFNSNGLGSDNVNLVLGNRNPNTDGTPSPVKVSQLSQSSYNNGFSDKTLSFNATDENGNPINSGAISAADVRSMFALDRLLRVTAFAGGHYEDQVQAHFGYKMPRGVSDEAYMLGAQTTDINIAEVVATSSTATKAGSSTTVEGAGTTIGDIAGKGFGQTSGQGDIHFECPSHGLVMAIFSIEPLPDYASMGCEVQNRKYESLDFYHPELDNVGMQPMFGDFSGISLVPNSEEIVGWSYRYQEHKLSFDVVNEGFYATDKDSWVGFKQSLISEPDYNSAYSLSQRFFVMPQYTNLIFLQNFPYLTSKYAHYTPVSGYFSSFKVNYNSPQNVYSGDNFLNCLYIKAFKTSIMSVHSLPKV